MTEEVYKCPECGGGKTLIRHRTASSGYRYIPAKACSSDATAFCMSCKWIGVKDDLRRTLVRSLDPAHPFNRPRLKEISVDARGMSFAQKKVIIDAYERLDIRGLGKKYDMAYEGDFFTNKTYWGELVPYVTCNPKRGREATHTMAQLLMKSGCNGGYVRDGYGEYKEQKTVAIRI